VPGGIVSILTRIAILQFVVGKIILIYKNTSSKEVLNFKMDLILISHELELT